MVVAVFVIHLSVSPILLLVHVATIWRFQLYTLTLIIFLKQFVIFFSTLLQMWKG